MGKQGPCFHCGVTSTPLWRNGPPDKPVLCNACGSRWRTKGTLANYTPLHARPDSDDLEDHRAMRVKSISLSKNNELKRKQSHDSATMVGGQLPDYSYNQNFRKAMDEEGSNRSSSGSAISNSESCAQFGGGDGSDLTGQAQSVVWESVVPSKRRTCVNRPKQSPVEKLTKDLYTIWQEQQSSYFSGSTEEDLLFESETPMVSVETGHGSVLIKHPNLIAKEEESEASSLSVDNKHSHSNEAYSHSAALHGNKGANFVGHGNAKMKISGHGTQQVPLRREKSHLEIFQMLGSHNSPLCHIDLSNALDYEVFVRHLTNEEQHKLLKYLPSVDVAKLPESLKSMFESPQFKENVVLFQQLLGEGLFDMTLSGEKPEDCKALRKLVISNFSKSKWVEHYSLLKSSKAIVQNSKASSRTSFVAGPNVVSSSNLTNVKRHQDNQNKKFPDAKIVMKSPKRVITKNSYEKKDTAENESSCFSPRNLFALPPESSSFLLDPINFVEEGSDQDLLLDVPSNGSFAQAELLHPSLSFGSHQASTSSSSVYTHVSSSLKNNIPAFVEP